MSDTTISDMKGDLNRLKTTISNNCIEFIKAYPGVGLTGTIETVVMEMMDGKRVISHAAVSLSTSLSAE